MSHSYYLKVFHVLGEYLSCDNVQPRSFQDIVDVYNLMLEKYSPYSKDAGTIVRQNKWRIDLPKVMFPRDPNASSFEAECAEAGFLRHDCGILTAYRATRTKEDNDKENVKLLELMDVLELKHETVIGWFKESHEKDPSEEVSFFVYDESPANASNFFLALYLLSEAFGQDSFLFKKAGITRAAFLINTNEDSRQFEISEANKEGRESTGEISEAGLLYLNLPPGIQKPLTKTDHGSFTFRKTLPSLEELEYSQNFGKK